MFEQPGERIDMTRMRDFHVFFTPRRVIGLARSEGEGGHKQLDNGAFASPGVDLVAVPSNALCSIPRTGFALLWSFRLHDRDPGKNGVEHRVLPATEDDCSIAPGHHRGGRYDVGCDCGQHIYENS